MKNIFGPHFVGSASPRPCQRLFRPCTTPTAMAEYDPTTESTLQLQTRLTVHVLTKGYQAGGIIGLLAVVPLQALRSRSLPSLARAARSCGVSSLVGMALSGVVLAAKATTIDRPGYEDRAYRLFYNEGQNRIDVMSAWGSALGLATGTAAAMSGLAPMSGLHLLGFAAAGSAAGVFAHMATMKKEVEKKR